MPWTWPHSIVPRALRKLARLALPARLEWALEYFLYYHDPGCEPELWHLPSICAGPGVAIDVGANIGYYTYPLSRMFDAVYAFEINPELTRAIETWGPGNVEIIDSGLSSGSGEATLYIPVHRGLPLTGWASLEPGNCPDTDEHLELAVRIDTLDAHGFERVDFMKIDVEGHELRVLRGARETLARCRPTILVEIKDRNVAPVTKLLRDFGYRARRLHDLVGVAGSRENFIFLGTD